MLSITHTTTYRYEPSADRAGLRLKLYPASTAAQQIESWTVSVNGRPVPPLLTTQSGEGEALWFSTGPVSEIVVVAEGHVTITDTAGVLGKFGAARPGVYQRDTELTKPDDAIRELAASIEGDGDLARMHALNTLIHDQITYRSGVSEEHTTAAQTLALSAGVCQDLTHVFISAARAMGLPARYVTGYLHEAEAPELATHAWAEVFLNGLGWTGFDPTHDTCPATGHVRLCSGYDADDSAPIRGHINGHIEEDLEIDVRIVETQSQSQSQQQ